MKLILIIILTIPLTAHAGKKVPGISGTIFNLTSYKNQEITANSIGMAHKSSLGGDKVCNEMTKNVSPKQNGTFSIESFF